MANDVAKTVMPVAAMPAAVQTMSASAMPKSKNLSGWACPKSYVLFER